MFARAAARPAVLVAVLFWPVAAASAQPAEASGIATLLSQLVTGPEGYRVTPIGLTADARRVIALEPGTAGLATQPRIVIVGGLDGSADGTRAVLDLVRWRLADRTIVRNRRRWQVAAVPCALPDRCDSVAGTEASSPAASATHTVPPFPPLDGFYDARDLRETRHLWRWITMLGPDLVIDVRHAPVLSWRVNRLALSRVPQADAADATSLAGALGGDAPGGLAPVPAIEVRGPAADVAAAVRALLDGVPTPSPSPLRRALVTRRARAPLDIARMLALRYPAAPSMSYIPALAWSGALRVSALTGDPQYRERAVAQMSPWLAAELPAISDPPLLTSLAGHQAFYDLGDALRDADAGGAQSGAGGLRSKADTLATTAADVIVGRTPDEIVRVATTWTDDMFMATSVLARASARTNDPRYADAVARLLTTYATRLQRDGLFRHADSGPHAWGRGNGFAAFGLMEALTHLPASWPARPQVLDSFRRLMDALRRRQAADGAWHQVVDEPGSYREFTVTAMTVAAMARGVRLGWLDASFDEVADRGWRAVQARITETGELVDVCTGTGAGRNATREYYLFRPAITGPDDRGGAMALIAALEMHALRAPR